MTTTTGKRDMALRDALKEAALAGLIALIIFGPMVGVVLNGYRFDFHGLRLAVMVLTVVVGRLLLSLF